jgi:23S rRNA U2552 (ribose-2'-O)-methylase RlmE/FtsJ
MAAFNKDNTYYLYKEHIDNPLHSQTHNQIHNKIHNKIERKQSPFVFPHILIKTTVINNQFNQIVKKTIKNSNITNVKNEINNYYKKEWDIVKKITNPCEMIYLTNKSHKSYSLSLYEPISRSYFKMIEMLDLFFNNLRKASRLKVFHLAEGPGGFIEGMLNFRENKNDKLFGITLISGNNSVPGWNKNNRFLNKQTNVNLITGFDNRGDLYNINNHYYLIDKFGKHSFDFMTADGGFDFSIDYNLQEELASKLIYAEVILMFSLLNKGGSFICKLFDTYDELTKQVVFLMFQQFEEVIIYKPSTSRPANSERYIICKNYNPISSQTILELINILNLWNKIDAQNQNTKYHQIKIEQIIDIEPNTKLFDNYTYFVNQLNTINTTFEKKQTHNIRQTINLIKYPPSHRWYRDNINNQIRTASTWCKRFGVPHKSYIYNLNYKFLYGIK